MKSTRLSLRIPPDLRASLEAKAKAAGLPIGRYMKRASSEAKVTTIITSEISRDQWVELGAALIALKARAPVIPCYIHGAPYDDTALGCLLMPAAVRLVFINSSIA